jgi:hypothetical protein
MIKDVYKREFREIDLEKIRVREEDTERDLEAFKHCLSFSFFDGEQIVCIMGIVKINDQTCEVFTVFDECATQYTRQILEYTRGFLAYLNTCFVRIQAVVRSDWPRSRRWVERLGFVCEGVMRSFGPDGKDYCMYARVKK